MNKILKYALPAVGLAAAAAGVTAFLIAPGHASEEKKAPFFGANIAHRGLHTRDKTVPENSLAAFRAAVDRGYGVELDVHITLDGQLVVFHDDDLERMCGLEKCLDDCTWEELQPLRLAGTEERIPLLSQVLEVVGDRAPIVLELKRGRQNRALCQGVRDALREYAGDICVESFDPTILRWWRRNAPEVLRGQLSCPREQFGASVSKPKAAILSRLLTNFLCRPQFIAYGLEGKKPLTVRLCEAMGAMKVCWTSHTPSHEDDNDTVIFEFYRPIRRFK